MGTIPASNRKEKTMSSPFDVLTQLDRIGSSAFDTARAPRPMPVDLFREGDQYVLSADLPGIDPESVDLDVDGQLLTIRAERRAPASEEVRWLNHERPYGSYMRQFTLGNGVDVEGITANYEHGVLSVIVPMAERAKPRKIAVSARAQQEGVRTGPEKKAVEA
jgi:HSP20 family protein